MTKYPMDQALTLSIPEAARLLGISRYLAYAATRRGDIPIIQIGKLRRVPKARLMKMIEGENEEVCK
ncbi:helix-turn-helix domain-containing protein [Chloroflexota bacterium]